MRIANRFETPIHRAKEDLSRVASLIIADLTIVESKSEAVYNGGSTKNFVFPLVGDVNRYEHQLCWRLMQTTRDWLCLRTGIGLPLLRLRISILQYPTIRTPK